MTASDLDAGVLVAIDADDVLAFGQGVSEEFWNLLEYC
jgi:hypothetical protein